MNSDANDKILRLASIFSALAKAEHIPKNSEETSVILKNIEKLETFAARKKYAEKNLSHLSSGSSRVVYLTSEKTVIKLAKNDKGIAQNKAEANPEMKSEFLNKILGHAKNYSWIETHFLEKITVKEFKEMTDLDFNDFGEAVSYELKNLDSAGDKKPSNFTDISKSKIFKEMKRIGNKFKLLPGDISRISSWGSKDDHPVLIDAGLTRKVFEDFYED